jgi:nucleoside-diphosphate-sugar epimerase
MPRLFKSDASSSKAMARVLVTGASGYIGQHLSLRLLAAGWQVRGMARSARPRLLQEVEWVRGDLADEQIVTEAVAGCDAIVHLACLPLAASKQNPVEAMRVNGVGTLRLLEAAQSAGVTTVIYASSGQVYGGRAELPNRETVAPNPDSSYAASKLCGENWCRAFANTTQMTVQILRLFNVYGSAADGSLRPTVESIFLRQLLQGQQPVVRGNLDEGRDFVHVDDVLAAIDLALVHQDPGQVMNIGTGKCTTMVELARQCARAVGASIEPRFEMNDQPALRFCAATEEAERVLGFRAQVPIVEGLQRLAKTMYAA